MIRFSTFKVMGQRSLSHSNDREYLLNSIARQLLNDFELKRIQIAHFTQQRSVCC